jgi:hypothetical protein
MPMLVTSSAGNRGVSSDGPTATPDGVAATEVVSGRASVVVADGAAAPGAFALGPSAGVGCDGAPEAAHPVTRTNRAKRMVEHRYSESRPR